MELNDVYKEVKGHSITCKMSLWWPNSVNHNSS